MANIHPLKRFRDEHKPPLSRAELGEMLGVSKITIWRWENAERFPERKYWARIREVTGIGSDELAYAVKDAPAPRRRSPSKLTERAAP